MKELTWTGLLLIAGSGLYILGFIFTAWFNLQIGPVSAPLAIFRALVWPLWWITMRPRGQRARGPD